jgi:hypothetical protein
LTVDRIEGPHRVADHDRVATCATVPSSLHRGQGPDRNADHDRGARSMAVPSILQRGRGPACSVDHDCGVLSAAVPLTFRQPFPARIPKLDGPCDRGNPWPPLTLHRGQGPDRNADHDRGARSMAVPSILHRSRCPDRSVDCNCGVLSAAVPLTFGQPFPARIPPLDGPCERGNPWPPVPGADGVPGSHGPSETEVDAHGLTSGYRHRPVASLQRRNLRGSDPYWHVHGRLGARSGRSAARARARTARGPDRSVDHDRGALSAAVPLILYRARGPDQRTDHDRGALFPAVPLTFGQPFPTRIPPFDGPCDRGNPCPPVPGADGVPGSHGPSETRVDAQALTSGYRGRRLASRRRRNLRGERPPWHVPVKKTPRRHGPARSRWRDRASERRLRDPGGGPPCRRPPGRWPWCPVRLPARSRARPGGPIGTGPGERG